jgi:hypothetical protein
MILGFHSGGYTSAMKMEAIYSSETSFEFEPTTCPNIPEDIDD